MKMEDFLNLNLLDAEISADRICHAAQAIHELDQWNSFDKYHQTADLLDRFYREAGADAVQRYAIPCDGETKIGDWVMPLAWDAQEGTLELLDWEGRPELLLADYKAVPNNLIRWSAPTEGTLEYQMVYLPEAEEEKDWAGREVKGRFVFTHSRARIARHWAVKYGAAGLVTDFSTAPREYPDAVHWENVWTDLALWGPAKTDGPMIGFSLSPSTGSKLKEKFSRRDVRTVRACVRAKLYAGSTDVVTATIAGADKPSEEIVCYAHVHEQQIDDNATSAAACVEMVRAARKLIESGAIPRPARTIRFVHGWEWIGSTSFAMQHKGDRKWLASLCLDGMAHKQEQTRSPVSISLSPTSTANFADAIFIETWKRRFLRIPAKAWYTTGWTAGTDTYWIDPHMGGLSNVYPFQVPGPSWHKSHTNVDMIDRDVAHASASASLAWMLAIAGAGAKEAARFAQISADRIERRIKRHAAALDASRHDADRAREQFLEELGFLEEAGRRMIDTSALAPRDAALAKTIEKLQSRLGAVIEDARSRANDVAASIRMAEPGWEASRPADLQRDRDERVADNLVPTRSETGYLWSLHRMTNEERWAFQAIGRIDPMALFLCDGKRTLAQIARRREFEQGPISVRDLVRHFRMLASAGYVQLAERHVFTADEMLKDLREIGIREGDTLLVHTSLFGLGAMACGESGRAAGGPEAIFRALEMAVGAGGTVAMPSFVHATIDRPAYDPAQTPAHVGELPDMFWRREGVLRSRHPSHGLAAKGRWAELIVRDNEKLEPYDIRGGFGKLYQLDAKIVMIGCGVTSNSTLHAVEDWAGLPSMVPASYHYLDAAGNTVRADYSHIPLGMRDFYTYGVSTYERLFRDKGIIREGRTGLARTHIMRTRDVMEYGLELLQKGRFEFLLGPFPGKNPEARALESKVKTEWKFPSEIWDKMKALRETPPG